MRKLLRQRSTGLWLGPSGLVRESIDAIEIQSFTEALKLCQNLDCADFELVLKFPNTEDDVAFPLVNKEGNET